MSELYLPCLRGVVGDWAYYSCIMKMKDVAERISYAEEIHRSDKLSKLIQRELDRGRGKKIKEYLINNKERFFNSMVVAVYEGDPEWYDIGNISTKLKKIEISKIPESVVETIGILCFSGQERLFALDGQHRLSGIKQALSDKPKLGEEELSVIFVAHKSDNNGLKRSRRLFTVLNKTAKPVVKREIIALDEDDTMAITVRRLIEENKYFKKDRISFQKGNNIPPTNVTSITTIENLYDILAILFTKILFKEKKAALTLNRLNDETLNNYYDSTCQFFDKLFNTIIPLQEYSGSNYSKIVLKYRTKNGGHVLFRPIGWSIIINVIAKLRSKYSLEKSIELTSKLPFSFSEIPYKGIVWNSSKNTIIMKGRSLATRLLLYMLNEEKNIKKLLDDYRKTLGEGFEKEDLPRKIDI